MLKKTVLLTSTLLTMGLTGIAFGITSGEICASENYGENKLTAADKFKNQDLNFNIWGYGDFDNRLTLIPYDYEMNNNSGMSTGQVVLTYTATALTDIAAEQDKYFNLKLPVEFNQLFHLKEDLRSVVMASYKLPEDAELTSIYPEDISTAYEGYIDFHLNSNEPIMANQTVMIKMSINYGKLLDEMNLGDSYDYQTIIPNANGSYAFRGILTSKDHIGFFPDRAAVGLTNGNSACVPVSQK